MTNETQILPCPFCGGGETLIAENAMPPTMNGKRSVISATVRHWCPKREGQPHGLAISMIGRDRESAIAAWNTRTPAIADGVDPDMPTQQLRLHFGELTNNEIRLVRAAIRFANSQRADGVGVEGLLAMKMTVPESIDESNHGDIRDQEFTIGYNRAIDDIISNKKGQNMTTGTVHLSMDGNCGCALLGANLQEGEAEFVCIDDAPSFYTDKTDREKWAMTQAHKRLCERLGVQLGYYWNYPPQAATDEG